MPWYAQYETLPETHWHWADSGSELEKAFQRIDYVIVRPDPPAAKPTGPDSAPILIPTVEVVPEGPTPGPAKRRR